MSVNIKGKERSQWRQRLRERQRGSEGSLETSWRLEALKLEIGDKS